MSRHGYDDDSGFDSTEDQWAYIRHRGAVESALRGKRGQAFLKELGAALDAMPEKKLVKGELEADGQFCALGIVGAARGLDVAKIDTFDWEKLSDVFGIAESMARQIMWTNDDGLIEDYWQREELCGPVTPEHYFAYPWYEHSKEMRIEYSDIDYRRWKNVRDFVEANLIKEK